MWLASHLQPLRRWPLLLAFCAVLAAGCARRDADTAPAQPMRSPPAVADFGNHAASPPVRDLAGWVAASGDNAGTGFVIIDKRLATLYLFDASWRLRASTEVLLGGAAGDDSVPGIGTRPIAQIQPHERTTPAGRFVAERGRNTGGEDVIWVDYDNAVSMHRVRAVVASERRLQRLATPGAEDNRISFGCINVPVAFYDEHIAPLFATHKAMVYVLPEQRPLTQVFPQLAPVPRPQLVLNPLRHNAHGTPFGRRA